MTERKQLKILKVKGVEKVGSKTLPKLTFGASDGEKDLWYHTFKQSIFDLILEGATIDCDVDTLIQNGVTVHRVVQVYVNNEPIVGKKDIKRYGKSADELSQMARTMSLSYAKDLAINKLIDKEDIITWAETFQKWVKEVK